MDVVMSSSVTITSPSLHYNPHVNSTPSSPPPSNSLSTPRDPDQMSEQQEQAQQSQLPPSTLPIEMDLSTSVPSLPGGAVLDAQPEANFRHTGEDGRPIHRHPDEDGRPNHRRPDGEGYVADTDTTMLDVEATPNGHLMNGEEIVMNGEQQQQQQWSSLNGSAEPSFHAASQQTPTMDDQAPFALLQLDSAGTQETELAAVAGSGSQQDQSSESMDHSTQLAEAVVSNANEAPTIVNGSTESPGDAMDTTQSETAAQAPSAEMGSSQGALREWVNAALGMPDGALPPVPTPPPAPATTEQSASDSPSGVPPPAGETIPPEDDGESTAPSDSDDEDMPAPSDFAEDTTVPDEEECKEIEAGPEVSGIDHEHFEELFFTDLNDPEYVPGDVGRIEWTVTGVRGTWEHPNKEALLRSPSVRIGGLDWNIKFYPRGNQTDYASVYLEVSMPSKSSSSSSSSSSSPSTPTAEAPRDAETPQDTTSMDASSVPDQAPSEGGPPDTNPTTPTPTDTQSSNQTASTATESETPSETNPPPAPSEEPVDSQMSEVMDVSSPINTVSTPTNPQERKEWSVPVQFGVVVYNPSDPRVHYSQGMHHRFGTDAPDWGSTRFCGPHNQLHKRRRGQRQALLRNDTLAFTAYIRIIHDDTQVLWDPNPFGLTWHSLAKTGMRALKPAGPDESFIMAAVSSWALLAPFRSIINAVPTGNPLWERNETPKVLTIALQRVLHRLVAQQKPSPSPVSLQPITDVISVMGSHPALMHDVVDFWESMRVRLDEELKGTSSDDRLRDLFDGILQRRKAESSEEKVSKDDVLVAGQFPRLRLPVRGVPSVQAAFAKTFDEHDGQLPAVLQKPPKYLQAELTRQWFDESDRTWKRVTDKIEIDEHIDLRPWTPDASIDAQYTLYGLIVHRGSLRTKNFQSVLRPGGPGTRWYTQAYGVSSVVCQTRKQAIEKHQGTSSEEGDDSDAIAYVVMYVRDDAVEEVLQGLPGDSEAPEWIKAELEREQAAYTSPVPDDIRRADTKRSIDVRIFRPELFMKYTSLGIFNIYSASAETLQSEYIIDLTMEGGTTVADVQKKLPELMKLDPSCHRCQLYRYDVLSGILGRAAAAPLPSNTLASETVDWPQMQYWVHVVKESKEDGQSENVPARRVTWDFWPAGTSLTGPPSHSSAEQQDVDDPSTPITPSHPSAEQQVVEGPPNPTPRSQSSAEQQVVDDPSTPITPSHPSAEQQVVDDPSTPTAPEASQQQLPTESEEADPEANATEDAPMPDVSEAGSVTPENEAERAEHDDDDDDEDGMDIEPPPPVNTYPPDMPAAELGRLRRVGRRMARRLVTGRQLEAPTTTIRDSNNILFFVKRFDARQQSLIGTNICQPTLPTMPVGNFLRNQLELPEDQRIKVWEEVNADRVRELNLSRTFPEERVEDGAILIVEEVLSDEEASQLEEQGNIISINRFVQSCADRMQSVFPPDDFIEYNYFLGHYFRGPRKYGSPHGIGKMIELNGDVYEGNFVLGKYQGEGRMLYQNSDIYEGGWHSGKMHGQGTFVYGKTGNTYVGGFRHGRRHGKGRMEYAMAEDELKLCQICYEEDIDALFYDCGHVCACQTCAKQLEDCPICRKPVINVVKMFWT
ncbi:MAG: hypothetical protein M1823_005584 [Watsoniomyces obsoletus]|nr:MAG: hypothetical protein M1823_005584 [Watsoniomyces obsoletus]